MASSSGKRKRRAQVRERRARSTGSLWRRMTSVVFTWPTAIGVLFVASMAVITLSGEATLGYSIGQRIDQPIYARVEFQVEDPVATAEKLKSAQEAVPSYYRLNTTAIERIRSDLINIYETAVASEDYAAFAKQITQPAIDEAMYNQLKLWAGDSTKPSFAAAVQALPIEAQYVAAEWPAEPRNPASTESFVLVEVPHQDREPETLQVERQKVTAQSHESGLLGTADATVGRYSQLHRLRPMLKDFLVSAFRTNPTIVYDQETTQAEIAKAKEATKTQHRKYQEGMRIIEPREDDGLTHAEYELLQEHRAAYLDVMTQDTPEALAMRRTRLLSRVGLVTIVGMLSVALLVHVRLHQPRILQVSARMLAFVVLMAGTLLAARLIDMRVPSFPEYVLAPCMIAGSILAIVYPPRFALGAMCILAVIVTTAVRAEMSFLLTLVAGLSVTAYALGDIRTRTKIISVGFFAALAVAAISLAGGLVQGESLEFVAYHAGLAGVVTLLASFIVHGVLPFVERMFQIATSLTLLEWRDPTKPLLQLLAREAPGTYNHCLVLGTLAEHACNAIGANGLLAQVGTLYHDIGKIHKAAYFAENQEAQINRHDHLAPTMSLLIILGHVKDGMEMAKEYKLPRVLRQFIEEHHGTTVVRYFHHVASEKQPQIASGRHDREVRESEFRYPGPKPRTRESAVVMICDGVESAVRSVKDPTVGRIESMVHQIISDRLNDGQFDDCDITLKELRRVEDALAKSLCSIYHGRVAYPKAKKPGDSATEEAAEPASARRLSG